MTLVALTNREHLLDAAKRRQLHHATILHGPSAEVLRETAFEIARALNCENGTTGDDCGSCHKIDKGIHPDVHHVAVAEDRKLISVEQIRTIVSGASLRPYEAAVKVFIIEPADAMTASGANALLKSLEEPGRDTVFLLLTRTPDLLLPTVRSRSQIVSLRVEGEGAANLTPQLTRIAAIFPNADPAELKERVEEVLAALHEYATSASSVSLLRLAAELSDHEPPAQMLALFGYLLRDLAAAGDFGDPRVAAIREKIPVPAMLRAADDAVRGATRLIVNVDVRLLFEQCVIELTRG